MPNANRERQLTEVQRIMRKQLAAWCNPAELTPEEITAVNEIIASGAAARFEDVAVVLNAADLGNALSGQTITGESTERLFAASVIQTCHRRGITLRRTGWPEPLDGETILTLSELVLA